MVKNPLTYFYFIGLIFTGLFLLFTILIPLAINFYSYLENSGLTIILNLCDVINSAYGLTCHQNPARCFHIFEIPMPLCVRCLGMAIGTFTASIVSVIFLPSGTFYDKIRGFFFLNKNTNIWIVILICIILMMPMGLDWFSQFIFDYDSPEFMRMTTGLFFGYLRGTMILSLLATAFEKIMKSGKLKRFHKNS